MDPIRDALTTADTNAFTRPIPKSVQAQVRYLVRQEKGSTKRVAQLLGVSQRSVERYLKGDRKNPPAAITGQIRGEVERRWQPRVRQKARQQAAAQNGILISMRGTFGYSAPIGTSDEPRVRRITQALPPTYARQLLDARTDAERRQALAQGLGFAYFQDGGRRAQDLAVEVLGIDYIDAEYL